MHVTCNLLLIFNLFRLSFYLSQHCAKKAMCRELQRRHVARPAYVATLTIAYFNCVLLKILWSGEFLGKYLSKSWRNLLATLVATVSFQGGLNKVIFLFLVLLAGWVLLPLYCSPFEYPEFLRVALFTGASASKTLVLLDHWDILYIYEFYPFEKLQAVSGSS